MPSQQLASKTSSILIVGAGVFGLSTAIHLALRGYSNVTIIDYQRYKESQYSYELGCDGASADINKIVGAGYGIQKEYQDLAIDALTRWESWNVEIETGQTLPLNFTRSDRLFINNGNLTMMSQSCFAKFNVDMIQNLTKSGQGDTQIMLTDSEVVDRAKTKGFAFAVNPFHRKNNYGVLDVQGGFVYADKACQFALYKLQTLGVKTILGGPEGTFAAFLRDKSSNIIGVRTLDGVSHYSLLTIMACGGWTPSLVPELDNLCETTAGSVCIFQLQKGTPLWDQLSPQNFPTWTYNLQDGEAGGVYGFARNPDGAVKIGYRGTKYTNPQTQADGVVRSVPVTRWTPQSTRSLPKTAAHTIKTFLKDFLPELVLCPMKTRLCWYTDSFDNHFLIDRVPGVQGLMVATGGSGHGFKYLPNLGEHVVDRIEGRKSDLLNLWRWRSRKMDAQAHNSIMEGVESRRALQKQVLTMEDSLTAGESRL